MAEHTIEGKKNRRFVNTGFHVTHSINEDLLNIKRKGDPEVSYVRYHWNPEVILLACFTYIDFFNLLNLFWHTDKNFCFYAEVNFRVS
jgi:hypothetical protein